MRTGLLLFLVILVANCHPYIRKLGTVTREECENNGKVYTVIVRPQCTAEGKTYYVADQDECDDDKGTFTPALAKCEDKTSDSDKTNNKDNSNNNLFNSFISFKFSLVFITYLLF